MIPLKIDEWNVRTLMDSAGSDRSQCRTELCRYRIGIATPSQFAEVGEIKEVCAGYTFFLSGRKSEERREAGRGFAMKSDSVVKPLGLTNGIKDHLMSLRLLVLIGNKHATIISAYVPTMTNPNEVKYKFHDDLDSIISATPRTDKENPSLVFSGDREIPTRGSTVPVGNEASPSFPLERWTRGLGFPGSTVHR